jgi:hypothetical protein
MQPTTTSATPCRYLLAKPGVWKDLHSLEDYVALLKRINPVLPEVRVYQRGCGCERVGHMWHILSS